MPGKKTAKHSAVKNALRLFIRLGILAAAFYLLASYVIFPYRMAGNAMTPYFRDGDLGLFYKLEQWVPNDIVLYRTKDGKKHVGRILAVAGQTITFPKDQEGVFLIDGYQLNEEIERNTEKAEKSSISFPMEVPEDSWFILNDDRKDTDDSRSFGCIKTQDIEGKLIYLFRRRDF